MLPYLESYKYLQIFVRLLLFSFILLFLFQLDIVVFPLPASCHGNMHGCDITRAGIGRLESNGEVLFCCSPEMADKGECRNAGRLLIETTGVSNRAVPIPGGSMDFDQAPSFDSLIELNFEGVYSVLIANCHPQGRAIHMTGGIEWINVPESAQAVMEEEIGTSPHKNNKDGKHKEEAANPSKSTTSDNHSKGHVDHAHHAKTFAETFHEVSFSVKDETKKELEQNEILPFVGIGIAGILIVGIVLRQKNLTRRYHLYDNTDLDELSIAGEDEDEMMDIDLPDTSLPNQRPETTLSVQL